MASRDQPRVDNEIREEEEERENSEVAAPLIESTNSDTQHAEKRHCKRPLWKKVHKLLKVILESVYHYEPSPRSSRFVLLYLLLLADSAILFLPDVGESKYLLWGVQVGIIMLNVVVIIMSITGIDEDEEEEEEDEVESEHGDSKKYFVKIEYTPSSFVMVFLMLAADRWIFHIFYVLGLEADIHVTMAFLIIGLNVLIIGNGFLVFVEDDTDREAINKLRKAGQEKDKRVFQTHDRISFLQMKGDDLTSEFNRYHQAIEQEHERFFKLTENARRARWRTLVRSRSI